MKDKRYSIAEVMRILERDYGIITKHGRILNRINRGRLACNKDYNNRVTISERHIPHLASLLTDQRGKQYIEG